MHHRVSAKFADINKERKYYASTEVSMYSTKPVRQSRETISRPNGGDVRQIPRLEREVPEEHRRYGRQAGRRKSRHLGRCDRRSFRGSQRGGRWLHDRLGG